MIMREKLPGDEKGLLEYGANNNLCNVKYATILGLSATTIAALQTLWDNFKRLHDLCANRDQTKAVTREKDKARDDYEEKLRQFIKELQANPLMTDPIREDYNINIRKTPSEVKPPPYGPDSEGESPSQAPGKVKVSYNGAKADPSLSVDIGYHIGDTAAQTHADLTFMDNFSHNPWMHVFPETQSGMVFTYALRWRSRNGVSEWSPLRSFRLA
jgi:hypothetical protein